jgi:hypothetical protein
LELPEQEIGAVTVGQEIELRAHQAPEDAIQVEVASLEPIVKIEEGVHLVGVLARLERGSEKLILGATGLAKIDAGRRYLGVLLYEHFVRHWYVDFWSWW